MIWAVCSRGHKSALMPCLTTRLLLPRQRDRRLKKQRKRLVCILYSIQIDADHPSTIRSVTYFDFQEPLNWLPADRTSVCLEPQNLGTAAAHALQPKHNRVVTEHAKIREYYKYSE